MALGRSDLVRLIHQDPAVGLLKLRLETPSDLWRIARLIVPGERVGASTTRRDPEAPAETAAAHKERRRIWLVVRAERVEFHGFSHHVRVAGPIVEGPFDLGRHHTLDIGPEDELTLLKERLTPADRALLEEGLAAKGEPRVVIACVDWGESSIVRLRGRAVDPVADINRTLPGKRYALAGAHRDRRAYVEEVLELLDGEVEGASTLVLAGPGFLKEELAHDLLERHPGARKKLRVLATAESGRVGVDELLRSGRASEVLAGTAAAEEADLVERLIASLAGGKRAAVGPRECREAIEAGAAETLLVSEELLRDPEVAPLLEKAREARARLFVVREDGAAGRRLAGLGRIGAILRFDWTSPTPRAR